MSSLEINGIRQLSDEEAAMDFDSMFEHDMDDSDGDDVPPIAPEPPPHSPRLCELVCRCVTFPMILLFTLISILLIIIFCIFPGLFLLGSIVALYYCCSRDPIPIRVLLRALFASGGSDDEDHQANRSKDEIYEKLVCRECIGAHHHVSTSADFLLEMDDYDVVAFSKPIEAKELLKTKQRKSSILQDIELQQGSIISDAAIDGLTTNAEDNPPQQQQTFDTSATAQEDDHPPQVEPQNDQPISEKEGELDTSPAEQHEGDETTRKDLEKGDEVKKCDQTGDPTSNEGESTRTSRSILKEAANLMQASPLEVEMTTLADAETPTQPMAEANLPDCDICLLPYETGQCVAWSKNLACSHCFHLDCIADWLVKHRTCPNCRAQYI